MFPARGPRYDKGTAYCKDGLEAQKGPVMHVLLQNNRREANQARGFASVDEARVVGFRNHSPTPCHQTHHNFLEAPFLGTSCRVSDNSRLDDIRGSHGAPYVPLADQL